jgi:hypothetical protein
MPRKPAGKNSGVSNGMPDMAAGGANTPGNGNGHDQRREMPDNASAELLSNDEIAARAYDIYEREGRMDGRDADHWFRAEEELRRERSNRMSQGTTQATNPAPTAPRSARQHQEGLGQSTPGV